MRIDHAVQFSCFPFFVFAGHSDGLLHTARAVQKCFSAVGQFVFLRLGRARLSAGHGSFDRLELPLGARGRQGPFRKDPADHRHRGKSAFALLVQVPQLYRFHTVSTAGVSGMPPVVHQEYPPAGGDILFHLPEHILSGRCLPGPEPMPQEFCRCRSLHLSLSPVDRGAHRPLRDHQCRT